MCPCTVLVLDGSRVVATAQSQLDAGRLRTPENSQKVCTLCGEPQEVRKHLPLRQPLCRLRIPSRPRAHCLLRPGEPSFDVLASHAQGLNELGVPSSWHGARVQSQSSCSAQLSSVHCFFQGVSKAPICLVRR